ncbi:hypothetical protein JCM17478_16600 [Thermopirellula anaerolimosa]
MECSDMDALRLEEERLTRLCEEIEQQAADLLLKGIDWAQFFRLILGRDGLVAKAFRSPEEMDWFTDSESYIRLHEMWAALRRTQEGKKAVGEPLVVMTIRVPKSLHESLIDEAHRLQTSVNKLCVAKLGRAISGRFVPKLPQFQEKDLVEVTKTAET